MFPRRFLSWNCLRFPIVTVFIGNHVYTWYRRARQLVEIHQRQGSSQRGQVCWPGHHHHYLHDHDHQLYHQDYLANDHLRPVDWYFLFPTLLHADLTIKTFGSSQDVVLREQVLWILKMAMMISWWLWLWQWSPSSPPLARQVPHRQYERRSQDLHALSRGSPTSSVSKPETDDFLHIETILIVIILLNVIYIIIIFQSSDMAPNAKILLGSRPVCRPVRLRNVN